jgi:hypothetical protein
MMAVFILTYTGMKAHGMANGNSTITILEEYDIFTQSYTHQIPPLAFGLSSFPPGKNEGENKDYG